MFLSKLSMTSGQIMQLCHQPKNRKMLGFHEMMEKRGGGEKRGNIRRKRGRKGNEMGKEEEGGGKEEGKSFSSAEPLCQSAKFTGFSLCACPSFAAYIHDHVLLWISALLCVHV